MRFMGDNSDQVCRQQTDESGGVTENLFVFSVFQDIDLYWPEETSESRGTDSRLSCRSLLSFLHFIMQSWAPYHVLIHIPLGSLCPAAILKAKWMSACLSACTWMPRWCCAVFTALTNTHIACNKQIILHVLIPPSAPERRPTIQQQLTSFFYLLFCPSCLFKQRTWRFWQNISFCSSWQAVSI